MKRIALENVLDIHTLEDLAEYINRNEDWPLNADLAIERNGWHDETGEDYGVCSDGKKKVVLDETGNAEVIDI